MALQRRVAPMGVTAAGVALAGLALSGCAARGTILPSGLDEGDGYGRPVGGVPPSTVPGNGIPADGTPVAITSLRVASTGPLGQVIVDNAGRTLYRFDRDRARPSTSNCVAACAREWPPVRWNAKLQVARDIPRAGIGTVRRADGSLQLTLGGWPLYRYSRDTAPGDANGQGVGGWSATRPNGAKAAFNGTPPPPGYGQGTGGVVIDDPDPDPPGTEAPPGSAGGGPPAPGP